ncbi:hypothetical protein C8A05DRAFT_17853 [Staphylotrichum tortipilum]|uniref:Uncharacterized protein n=1 Tax=Staphylotrichum tortipilum TaxID=2831512 RepID=A0AAN6MFB4_9PEZI|nr:hypothetical protein C8A05DRAFT_17853 [Staphylotrichum longicolle]
MSVPSASSSPLQLAAGGQQPDETKMPKGHCRYILLQTEIKGQRCACVCFSLNTGIPGATCACGHLACFHNKEPEVSTDQKHELEQLKKRLQHLEDEMSRGQEDVLDSVVSRLNEVEEQLEKSRDEFGEQIKNSYRNVSMTWQSIEQAGRRTQQHDEQLRQIYEKLQDHNEQLDRLHAGQLELRDADLSLEERIENLTETLEEEEELRLSAAMSGATRPPRRRSTSDTSRPNVPLGPLGRGAAQPDTQYHPRYRSPTGGPSNTTATPTFFTTPNYNPPGPCDGTAHAGRPYAGQSPRRLPASARSTGPWTVHISLLPHAFVPMPFERNTNAYQRCLSRGLHQMVAVQGRDAASFRAAVERAFGRFLRGREWMPLQAKLCDAETLQGLPMLRPLDDELLRPADGGAFGTMFDHEFLMRQCAVVDANGVIDSLYIAMRRHTLSWHTLRHSAVYMDGLEGCWAYDALLDTDPFHGDMAVDDEDRPAAGHITTAPVVVAAAAGMKRPLTEMSRSNSFGSATAVAVGSGTSAAAAAGASGSAVATGAEGEEQARVKRACPAPPQGAIVEIRRRDIKTA